jgi:hypothetical protein
MVRNAKFMVKLGVLSFIVAATAALVVYSSLAQATSPVATYGGNWGRSTGVNEDIIHACDGEDDGVRAFTQYHVGGLGVAPGTYWTVWDTDGPNNGCMSKNWTGYPYYARAVRACESPGGDAHCGPWKYTDGLGGS